MHSPSSAPTRDGKVPLLSRNVELVPAHAAHALPGPEPLRSAEWRGGAEVSDQGEPDPRPVRSVPHPPCLHFVGAWSQDRPSEPLLASHPHPDLLAVGGSVMGTRWG